MLKIAVFCGGTGSVALQKGFASLYGIDRVRLDVIVNAYDNGKSTGTCRRVFENRILGPSDVRKNQLLQYAIRYKDAMEDPDSREARLYRLFEVRLSADSPRDYYETAKDYLRQYGDILDADDMAFLEGLIDHFFFEDGGTLRRTFAGESFRDFSLSNIFYAACAAKCGNSLEAAMDRMAKLLGLRDTVHLISDRSLILKAETRSGYVIEDEGEIVTWDDPGDKIARAILMDGSEEYIPSVDEGSRHAGRPVSEIIREADIIIFSSGTQWSSLIPTYMHRGFREMIKRAPGKKYLVMNNAEDHDIYGVDAAELCGVLENYLDMDELTVVVNENAVPSMASVPVKYHSIRGKLGEPGTKTHIPEALVGAIMADYYRDALGCGSQLFDLDGTLWNEKGDAAEMETGEENLALFEGPIVSGNGIEHIRGVLAEHAPAGKDMPVYADYGNTFFTTAAPDRLSRLTERYDLPAGLQDMFAAAFAGKSVKVRGDVVMTIKPLEDRERLAAEMNETLAHIDGRLIARPAGRTSIDIMDRGYTKAAMMERIFRHSGIDRDDVVFIGNELRAGSEKSIAALGIHTLQVDDVYECYVYLKTRAFFKDREENGNKE